MRVIVSSTAYDPIPHSFGEVEAAGPAGRLEYFPAPNFLGAKMSPFLRDLDKKLYHFLGGGHIQSSSILPTFV